MRLRTKEEQKAYLDGFERCAECIKKYLSDKGKNILECQLMAVRSAIGIEDIEPQAKSENNYGDCDTCLNKHTDNCNNCTVAEYQGKRVSFPTNYKKLIEGLRAENEDKE